jgi:hypothetical protein
MIMNDNLRCLSLKSGNLSLKNLVKASVHMGSPYPLLIKLIIMANL